MGTNDTYRLWTGKGIMIRNTKDTVIQDTSIVQEVLICTDEVQYVVILTAIDPYNESTEYQQLVRTGYLCTPHETGSTDSNEIVYQQAAFPVKKNKTVNKYYDFH